MQQIAAEAEIPGKCIDWIKEQGIVTVKKLALAATIESDVQDLLIQPMIAAKIEECRKLGNQTAVKEFWILSRDSWEGDKKKQQFRIGVYYIKA